MSEQQKKIVLAKLYNFKSSIEGMVSMVQADVFDLKGLDNAAAALCGKLMKDLADVSQDMT